MSSAASKPAVHSLQAVSASGVHGRAVINGHAHAVQFAQTVSLSHCDSEQFVIGVEAWPLKYARDAMHGAPCFACVGYTCA
jgi:hypothetical protein